MVTLLKQLLNPDNVSLLVWCCHCCCFSLTTIVLNYSAQNDVLCENLISKAIGWYFMMMNFHFIILLWSNELRHFTFALICNYVQCLTLELEIVVSIVLIILVIIASLINTDGKSIYSSYVIKHPLFLKPCKSKSTHKYKRKIETKWNPNRKDSKNKTTSNDSIACLSWLCVCVWCQQNERECESWVEFEIVKQCHRKVITTICLTSSLLESHSVPNKLRKIPLFIYMFQVQFWVWKCDVHNIWRPIWNVKC